MKVLAETILLAIQQQREIGALRASVNDMVTMVGSALNEMPVMQADIRGLQTEN